MEAVIDFYGDIFHDYGTLIVLVAVFILYRSIWGYATRAIVHNKGYQEDWFWWGFFFALIALIVAICKPNYVNTPEYLNRAAVTAAPDEQKEQKEQTELQNANALREYAKLVQEGVITLEEFEKKKEKILSDGK